MKEPDIMYEIDRNEWPPDLTVEVDGVKEMLNGGFWRSQNDLEFAVRQRHRLCVNHWTLVIPRKKIASEKNRNFVRISNY